MFLLKMYYIYLLVLMGGFAEAKEGLVCGGFIISHAEIDYTKIEVELYTKNGIWKDKTTCAPTSGYYFIPVYDNGDYIIQLIPPPGWSFTPDKKHVKIDGVNDVCSKGENINFHFQGFGITGIVESYGTPGIGPANVNVELRAGSEVRKTTTKQNGVFFFTPVIPGQYSVTISHGFWRIFKNTLLVKVEEGNTDLPLGSLVVSGYDVTGYVKNEGHPADGIELVLFQHPDNKNAIYFDGCKKAIIKELEHKGKQLCHLSSSAKGNFTFDVVSPGHYFIMPYFKGKQVHFFPEVIGFQIGHDSVLLPDTFRVMGYSVFGSVRASKGGKPIKDANVFINSNKITTTKHDGSFVLENIKADTYIISVTAENMQFQKMTLKINQHVPRIPDFIPSSYKVCGIVLSEQTHNVLIIRTGTTQTLTVRSELPDGKFCVNLAEGKYSMQVILNQEEKLQGAQFFPVTLDFQVIDKPVLNIQFSQLKATVVGKVICNNSKDCNGVNVVLKLILNQSLSNDKVSVVSLQDNNTYLFDNVRQGSYEVSIAPNKFCWEKPHQIITVSSTNELVPPFVQSGYLVAFISSHQSKVNYKLKEEVKSLTVDKGRTSLCLAKPGLYEFQLESCHQYENDVILHNTKSTQYEIYLTAIKHTVIVEIECAENYSELYMIVNMDGVKTQHGPLQFKDGRYFISLVLQPTDSVILLPYSEVLFVYPPILSIDGQEDCTNLGVKFSAKKGRIFVGSIIPPLEGVLVTIETDNSDTLNNETDKNGRYWFPPQNDSKTYKVYATKDSYILFGPDDQGNFIAHKLAKISVSVLFEDSLKPLQDVLLSLSGGQRYRKNIQTGEDGIVTFPSLTPGEYFLKPMKKEYSFEPSTKLIIAEEGATIPITLKGKRIAFSAYGQVSSLNGEPEERVTILASGTGNCSRSFEEGTSEANGQFRIRGLHPYCTYNVTVKHTIDDKRIERGSPSSFNISLKKSDIHGLKFTVFRSALTTDVLVRVYCKNADLYKTLRLSVSRESEPSGLIHTTKLENYKLTKNNIGMLVYLPSLPLDDRTYSLQLQSTITYSDNEIQYFITNSSIKYLHVDCNSQKDGPAQNIKQTSVWTLLIIFLTFIAVYNSDYTIQLVKAQLNKLNIGQTIYRTKPIPTTTEYVIDKKEINQIAESINPTKRKLKSRKT